MSRRGLASALALACLAALALAPAAGAAFPAKGNFGINGFDVEITDREGNQVAQAGSHPFAMTTSLQTNVDEELLPEGWLRDIFVEQMPGLVGDTTAYPRCSTLEFLIIVDGINSCQLETQVGIAASAVSEPGLWTTAPVFNLVPPPGVLLRLGFHAVVPDIIIDISLSPEAPHNPVAASRNTPQLAFVYGSKIQLWGDPVDSAHDPLRGTCGAQTSELPPGEIDAFEFENQSGESCEVARGAKPFLTLPTTCAAPLATNYEAFSWEGEHDAGGALTHDGAGNPAPLSGCGSLPPFGASIAAQPTSRAAESPTGLDLSLNVADEGLTAVEGRAQSHIRRVALTLPEGMTANPSLAEGLAVCSIADLGRERLGAAPGAGCPEAAKIGTIEVESPLISEPVRGALYQAEPHANLAGNSLIAFYIVLRNERLGIIVKQPVRVEPDPHTGQLRGITENIPQLPFSSFRLKFREGGRSPLISPPLCGTHRAEAVITPWSGAPPITESSSFEIIAGPNGGPCPAGAQPFEPGFEAGAANNAAGQFSPFGMQLTRRDGDQDIVRFDATLPPGVLAKLAGVARCSDAQIAIADAKSGRAELAAPSCPPGSAIGRVISGAGVGSQLTYVRGALYLAGPFGGAPLSAVAIVPAVAGPFDVGTVVVRQALTVDPKTGIVRADGGLSQPIPHILAGIPLRVREIQVHVDRHAFTLNPTSCEPMATEASIWAGGANPFSIADDFPVARSARFQAADCARLGFKPHLRIDLRGGTRRGANPALRAVLRPRPGDANIKRTVVRLPRSAFLEQAHIRTICTRVQWAQRNCPKGSIYGRVIAHTPLLDEPLRGFAYLRSSNNKLPDLVFDLRGLIEIESSARIDSIRGGIRAIFAGIPDAPLNRVVVNMAGGKRSLIVNSTDLCRARNRAQVRFDAHSGKRANLRPLVRAQKCAKQRKAKRGAQRRSG